MRRTAAIIAKAHMKDTYPSGKTGLQFWYEKVVQNTIRRIKELDDEPVWKKIKAKMASWTNAAWNVFKGGLTKI